jgi:hypothetical protein
MQASILGKSDHVVHILANDLGLSLHTVKIRFSNTYYGACKGVEML